MSCALDRAGRTIFASLIELQFSRLQESAGGVNRNNGRIMLITARVST
jgi:hypothetical protein